jgi:hypothetical protein
MDETRKDLTQSWGASESSRASRSGLRVSDAERDVVVTELGEHFQTGRLDQAEFDDRVTRALTARTGRDLDVLLADLPPAQDAPGALPSDQRRLRLPFRLPVLVPLLFIAVLMAGSAAGGWHHQWAGGWAPWPLLWLIPLSLLRFGWWRRSWRRQLR